jgi:hypothetical protein
LLMALVGSPLAFLSDPHAASLSQAACCAGRESGIAAASRFHYGAIAVGLPTEAEIAPEIDPDPFLAWRGFSFADGRKRPRRRAASGLLPQGCGAQAAVRLRISKRLMKAPY